MKIHDTKTLHKRAKEHARYDHIKQGTYGRAETNGKTDYEGCAVSCLATPSEPEILQEFIKEMGVKDETGDQTIWKMEEGHYKTFFRPEQLRQTVTEQFGITEKLMELAEGFFEGQSTHGLAIEFFKDFALSLKEGTEITDEMAEEWFTSYTGGSLLAHYEGVVIYVENRTSTESGDNRGYDLMMEEFTEAFLAFCEDPTKILVA
jgi:hypothetical protein